MLAIVASWAATVEFGCGFPPPDELHPAHSSIAAATAARAFTVWHPRAIGMVSRIKVPLLYGS
jgi:hypothetical protein